MWRSKKRPAKETEVHEWNEPMDDALVVYIPYAAKHLLHQSCALGFGVVVVGLLVQPIEEFPSLANFLDEVYFRM